MNEENEGVKVEVEENNQVESPTTNETSEEVLEPQAEVETTVETEVEGANTETEESRKNAGSRIRELNTAKKAAEQENLSLKARIAELTRTSSPSVDYQPKFDPQEPLVKPGEELTADELNARMAQRDQRLIQTFEARSYLRSKQAEVLNNINAETSESIKSYPELDPESESFNPELSETITEAVEAHIKADPYNASVKRFVEKLMKPYKGAVEKEVGQVSEKLARQVSSAALRPTSIHKQEKTAAEKSITELEAELGVINS